MIARLETPKTKTSQFHLIPLNQQQVDAITNKYLSIAGYEYAFSHQIKWVSNDESKYYGLYNEDTMLAYLHGYNPLISGAFWIQTFMVFPEYLRQGLGTQFFHLMIKHLQTNSPLTDIYLACYDANESGQCFWQSLGFTIIKTFPKPAETTCVPDDYSLLHLSFNKQHQARRIF